MGSTHQFSIEDRVCAQPMEGDVLAWILHAISLQLGQNGICAPAKHSML
jgi:hypothetical protein